jgi:nucleoside phosphorylase
VASLKDSEAEGGGALVLAAFAPELSGFERVLGPGLVGRVGERAVRAAAVGVGLVASAAGAALALERVRPALAILVGTCGVYPGKGARLGQPVVSRRLVLVEPAVVEGRAALPDIVPRELFADEGLGRVLAALGAPLVDVATTVAVTTDDRLAETLGGSGEVEHLEAFAVASACAGAGVPFVAVLGVANLVGSRGRSEWRANHLAAGGEAASLVLRWLAADAPRASPAGES